MIHFKILGSAVLLAVGIAASSPALARDGGALGLGGGGGGRLPSTGLLNNNDVRRVQPLSAADAARIAQQQNGGGRVLSVDRSVDGYSVKLLKNGDVRVVFVPGS
jgi:hypothetical protein